VVWPGGKKVQFRGSLTIASSPAGASVALDGVRLGVTPLLIQRVPAGSHALRIEKQGHRVSASAVQVVADRRTTVSIALDVDISRNTQ
jgi:hypothetical protein